VPKEKDLVKKYKLCQEMLEVVPKGKSLAKRHRFSHEKIEGR
jgi:hypothetical protein